MKNRCYVGEYRYGDTVTPDGMPAIVPQDIFDAVQERIAKNKHTPAATKADEEYILTTKLFCRKDGVMMVGKSGTSKTKKSHHYYGCINSFNVLRMFSTFSGLAMWRFIPASIA